MTIYKNSSGKNSSEKRQLFKEVLIFTLISFAFSWTISFLSDWGFLQNLAVKKGSSFANMCTLFIRLLLMTGPAIGSIFVVKIYRKGSFPKWKWGKPHYYLIVAAANFIFWMFPVFISSQEYGSRIFLNPFINQYQWIVIISELSVSWIGGIGEELGWSVYLLTRLTPQLGRIKATMVSGILRGFWHLPIIMGSVYLRVSHGEIGTGTFLLVLLVYCILQPAMGILLSSIWGAVWHKTRSIPLIGWTHQSYDAVRDIAAIAIINFGSNALLYNICGVAVLLTATAVCLILMSREEKRSKAEEH